MTIKTLLLECGLCPAHKGFHFLEQAIAIRMTEPDLKLIDGIFIKIARSNHTTVGAVERACRYALVCSYDAFGPLPAIRVLRQPPCRNFYTAGDFIALAAYRCSQGEQFTKAVDF